MQHLLRVGAQYISHWSNMLSAPRTERCGHTRSQQLHLFGHPSIVQESHVCSWACLRFFVLDVDNKENIPDWMVAFTAPKSEATISLKPATSKFRAHKSALKTQVRDQSASTALTRLSFGGNKQDPALHWPCMWITLWKGLKLALNTSYIVRKQTLTEWPFLPCPVGLLSLPFLNGQSLNC